jgi:hypothetical protein
LVGRFIPAKAIKDGWSDALLSQVLAIRNGGNRLTGEATGTSGDAGVLEATERGTRVYRAIAGSRGGPALPATVNE